MKFEGEWVNLELAVEETHPDSKQVVARGHLSDLFALEVVFYNWGSVALKLRSSCCGRQQELKTAEEEPLAAWEMELLGGPAGKGEWRCEACKTAQPWVSYIYLTIGTTEQNSPDTAVELETWCAHLVSPFEQRFAALELTDFFEDFLARHAAVNAAKSWGAFQAFLSSEGFE